MPGDSINDTTPATSVAQQAALQPDSSGDQTSPTSGGGVSVDPSGGFVWTDGWYVAIACGVGLATADTRIGPIVAGILTIALIYQLTLLLQGK